MRLALFDYALPEDRIAARPTEERDGARLMIMRDAAPRDARVRDLPSLLPRRALVVVNDTRVIPARLAATKPSGGRVELFLVELEEQRTSSTAIWRCMVRSSKKTSPDAKLAVEGGVISARVLEPAGAGLFRVELEASSGALVDAIEAAGHVPLPPYIKRADDLADRERYQTVFAASRGAVAAPTAGLHFSERLVAELAARDIEIARVTLHVSLGTFKPVTVDDLDDHAMHAEWYEISETTTEQIRRARARGAPVIAIGTTSLRALESAADPARPGLVRAGRDRTRLLIQPGYRFRVVDSLFTNFHLPKSTLLALVCAFGGRATVLRAYRAAVERGYRFFSYGDAMLLSSHVPTSLRSRFRARAR
ncbi:MAG: tRNA preQ1(34) S-adenosylmethionine ribosyltransferase-isomerase QueA [Polyangiaceae bacterium]